MLKFFPILEMPIFFQLSGPDVPRQKAGEDPTDLYRELVMQKYGIRVREEELGVVHRVGYKVICKKKIIIALPLCFFLYVLGRKNAGRACESPQSLQLPENFGGAGRGQQEPEGEYYFFPFRKI